MSALDALNRSNLSSVMFCGIQKKSKKTKSAPATTKRKLSQPGAEESTQSWMKRTLQQMDSEPVKKKSKKNKPKKLQSHIDVNMKGKKRPAVSTFHLLLQPRIVPRYQRIIGIDMSLTNPGLTVLNLKTKTASMYCLRNRQKEKNGQTRVEVGPFQDWTLSVSVLEPPPGEEETQCPNFVEVGLFRYRGYFQLVMQLLAVIGKESEGAVIGIEHYSFMSKNTNATSILIELGSLLRGLLMTQGYPVLELPPTTVKNLFSDSGRASKDDMHAAFRTFFELPSLYGLLHLQEKGYTATPHPIEDLVDSMAVALATLYLMNK